MNVLNQVVTDKFALYNADCVDVVRSLPNNSIDFSVYSRRLSRCTCSAILNATWAITHRLMTSGSITVT